MLEYVDQVNQRIAVRQQFIV